MVPSVDGLGSTTTWLRSPKLSTSNSTAFHYGLSFLFVNQNSVLVSENFKGIITMDVSFFTYNGDNGVGLTRSLGPSFTIGKSFKL
jgi:hypothetical protein